MTLAYERINYSEPYMLNIYGGVRKSSEISPRRAVDAIFDLKEQHDYIRL